MFFIHFFPKFLSFSQNIFESCFPFFDIFVHFLDFEIKLSIYFLFSIQIIRLTSVLWNRFHISSFRIFYKTFFNRNYIQSFQILYTFHSPWYFSDNPIVSSLLSIGSYQKRYSQEALLSFFTRDVKSLVLDLSSPFVRNTWFGVLWTLEKQKPFLSNFWYNHS